MIQPQLFAILSKIAPPLKDIKAYSTGFQWLPLRHAAHHMNIAKTGVVAPESLLPICTKPFMKMLFDLAVVIPTLTSFTFAHEDTPQPSIERSEDDEHDHINCYEFTVNITRKPAKDENGKTVDVTADGQQLLDIELHVVDQHRVAQVMDIHDRYFRMLMRNTPRGHEMSYAYQKASTGGRR